MLDNQIYMSYFLVKEQQYIVVSDDFRRVEKTAGDLPQVEVKIFRGGGPREESPYFLLPL